MSLSGNLHEFSVLETLQLIGLQKKTGTLEVISARHRRTFQFQEGMLLGCFADRPEDPDPLLEGLVALGICEIRQARSWRGAGAHLDLEALRERCGLDEAEFASVRRLLLQGTIDQVLLWDHGQFCFTPLPPAIPNPAPVNLEEILLESMRRLDEAVELRNGGLPPQAIPHAVSPWRETDLADEEPAARWLAQAVLRHCDGKHPLKRIRSELGIGEYDLLTAVSALRLHGRVRVVTRGRGENAAEPLLDQPRRLPNPAAPFYAVGLVVLVLLSGWAARAVTAGPIDSDARRARAARAQFELERSTRHLLEVYRLREGRYPDALSELVRAELWPDDAASALAALSYRADAGGGGYALSPRGAAASRKETALPKSSKTADR